MLVDVVGRWKMVGAGAGYMKLGEISCSLS